MHYFQLNLNKHFVVYVCVYTKMYELPMKFIHTSLTKVTFVRQLSITFIQFDRQGNSFRPEHKLQYDNWIYESMQ